MCVFCRITAGEDTAAILYQDELVTAFLDVMPANPGHTLVVPNLHASGLADLPPETLARMAQVGQKIAAALMAGSLSVDGVNLYLADGQAAGQTVHHVHLHVIPRHLGDRELFHNECGHLHTTEELNRLAALLKPELS